MKENVIPRNTKHATKFGMTLFKGKMWKLCQNVTKKPFKFPWKFCLGRHAWINQWFLNKSCLLWWPVWLSIRYRPRLTTFDLFYTTILKITKEIFVKICWQLKTPTPTWKCTRCIMQMSYLYASAFLSKLLQTSSTCRSNMKTMLGKRVMKRKGHCR